MLLFLSGIGVSMNIASTVEIIPHYLEKRKSVGYACLGLGEGIALVTLPYLFKLLLNGYGFKLTLLYISPIALLSLVGLVVFIQPKQSCDNRLKGSLLIQSYFDSLKRLVSPFYLFNSLLWQGGLAGVVVLGFTYLVDVSSDSVALLSYTIMGIAFHIGSLSLVSVLLKFKVNHYILQITLNATLGASTIILTFMNTPSLYYVCFGVIGILYGATISNMTCLRSHLYHSKDVEYTFGFMQVFGSIGAAFVRVTAAMIKEQYGVHTGMYHSGGMLILASITLIIPALIQPKIWQPIKTKTNMSNVKVTDDIQDVGTWKDCAQSSCELQDTDDHRYSFDEAS